MHSANIPCYDKDWKQITDYGRRRNVCAQIFLGKTVVLVFWVLGSLKSMDERKLIILLGAMQGE